MKKINVYGLVSLLALAFIIAVPHHLNAQDGDSILQKMDKVIFAPKDKQGKIKIVLIDKKGNEKAREAIMLQKGTDKKLYRYTAPESEAGIATLSLPDGVMWLYLPALGKPKKISFLMKNQAFVGTDFSYEDMATTPYADRYNAKLLNTAPDTYVLELTPRAESEYSKIVVTIDRTNYYPITMEYYDSKGNKIKEADYKYVKTGKYWNAGEVSMTDLKKEHTTKILMYDVKFDQGLSDDEFTVENLTKQ